MLKLPSNDNKFRSKPHRRVETILDEMNVNYYSEQHFPPYIVDIYLPEWHLAIEIDGPFHSKIKDKIRDSWLKERYGLLLLRIDVKMWRTKTYIQDRITSFLEKHAESTKERKSIWSAPH